MIGLQGTQPGLPIVLERGDVIEYVPITQNLGRAEFLICPVFRRGRLQSLYIERQQQTRSEIYYVVHELNSEGLAVPAPWRFAQCKKHRTVAMLVYVPDGSSRLTVSRSSITVTVRFE